MSSQLFVLVIASICVAGCAVPRDGASLAVVPHVELERYAGRWHEIAKYPVSFEAGCRNVVAEYTLRPDGKVTVVNRCDDDSPDGFRSIEGIARVPDAATPSKLKVSFFWPFEADYWIIDLHADYQWVVVGEPGRRFLWILSRSPVMDESVYESVVSRLPAAGYDPARLERTPTDAMSGCEQLRPQSGNGGVATR